MRALDRFPQLKERGSPLMTLILTLSFVNLVVGVVGVSLWHAGHRWVGGLLVVIAGLIAALNRDIADPYWHSKDPKKPQS